MAERVRFVSSRVPRMNAFGDITYWQEAQLRRLAVTIRTGSFMEIDEITQEAPDLVVLATGAAPRTDAWQRHRPAHVVPGADLPHVRSSLETLVTPVAQLGATAAVLDDLGHFEAAAVAEYLVGQGISVTLLTRFAAFMPNMEAALRTGPSYERMHRTGRFQVRTRAVVDQIHERSVSVFDEQLDAQPQTIPADSVVLVTYSIPDVELAEEVAVRGLQVRRVGDALSPRYIENAIRDGYMAGLAV